MKFKKIISFISVLALSASLIPSGIGSAYSGIYNMTYMYPGTNALSYVDNTKDSLSSVSLNYFGVDKNSDGSVKLTISSSLNTTFINQMHAKGIKVVPYIQTPWSDQKMAVFAMDQREKLTSDIAAAVAKYNLDGINVDIENLPASSRDAQTDFMKLLRSKIPAQKEVSIAVASNPKGLTTGWVGSYDYVNLSKYSTHLMIMAYDQHSNGSPEGPVAGLPWVEATIQKALSQGVPASKIVLGIPFYGRYWKTDGSVNGSSVTMKTMDTWIEHYKPTLSFNTTEQTAYASLTVKTGDTFSSLTPGTYHIWYENEDSLKAKLALVDKYQLKGAGTWALSQEKPEVWDYYSQYLNLTHYTVYQNGEPVGEYTNLNDAKNIASKYNKAHIVNNRTDDSIWDNYPIWYDMDVVETNTNLILYASPTKTSRVIGTIKPSRIYAFAHKDVEGGWYQVDTASGQGWVNISNHNARFYTMPQTKQSIQLLSNTPLYLSPLVNSNGTLNPGTYEATRSYGLWTEIVTPGGKKWIKPNQVLRGVSNAPGSVQLFENEKLYDSPLSTQSNGAIKPLNIAYLSSYQGWYLVNTYLGQKWIKPTKALPNIKNESGQITFYENTPIYNAPYDAKSVSVVKPLTIPYISSSNGWYRVNTYLGYKWMNPKKALPNVSKASGTLRPSSNLNLYNLPGDTVAVGAIKPTILTYIESSSGWYRVNTYLGYKWVQMK